MDCPQSLLACLNRPPRPWEVKRGEEGGVVEDRRERRWRRGGVGEEGEEVVGKCGGVPLLNPQPGLLGPM